MMNNLKIYSVIILLPFLNLCNANWYCEKPKNVNDYLFKRASVDININYNFKEVDDDLYLYLFIKNSSKVAYQINYNLDLTPFRVYETDSKKILERNIHYNSKIPNISKFDSCNTQTLFPNSITSSQFYSYNLSKEFGVSKNKKFCITTKQISFLDDVNNLEVSFSSPDISINWSDNLGVIKQIIYSGYCNGFNKENKIVHSNFSNEDFVKFQIHSTIEVESITKSIINLKFINYSNLDVNLEKINLSNENFSLYILNNNSFDKINTSDNLKISNSYVKPYEYQSLLEFNNLNFNNEKYCIKIQKDVFLRKYNIKLNINESYYFSKTDNGKFEIFKAFNCKDSGPY